MTGGVRVESTWRERQSRRNSIYKVVVTEDVEGEKVNALEATSAVAGEVGGAR